MTVAETSLKAFQKKKEDGSLETDRDISEDCSISRTTSISRKNTGDCSISRTALSETVKKLEDKGNSTIALSAIQTVQGYHNTPYIEVLQCH